MKKWLCVLLVCVLLAGGATALAMTEGEAIARAKEAVWQRLGDDTVPLDDTQAYAVSAVNSYYVLFGEDRMIEEVGVIR